MKLVQWKTDYDLGVPSIDEQHRHLVDMLNMLNDLKVENKGVEIQKSLILELVEYTKIHFNDEEAHMMKNRYPGLIEHRRQHKILIDQIVGILKSLKDGKTDVTDDIMEILKNWLMKHILRQDKDYGNFLNE